MKRVRIKIKMKLENSIVELIIVRIMNGGKKGIIAARVKVGGGTSGRREKTMPGQA